MQNDIIGELGQNFIEYAVAVNTDRAIPNANDGLKPVAKRIIYGAYDCGFKSNKPHVKCANVIGNVMADFHPHGDTSIYGALVRLSQPWTMRYPLIDFHGSNGNIDGDGPAAYRYTEARLSKLVEDGMLCGIKKNVVDFIPNYSESKNEPIELPSIFPNLLCNPNAGIGVAIASSWAPHNLKEVAEAIYDYIDGKDPYLAPDFPTGGIVINKKDIINIIKTGHGTVKIRGKYNIEKNNIVFTEIPYGTQTEDIISQIGKLADENENLGITDIRNESNKKGFRLVIECDKQSNINLIVNKLFAKTSLQNSFSYNQVALVDKVPTELNLKDCIKIYIDYNTKCIIRECEFDINKAEARLHIIIGLLKALDIIDEIIALIKSSSSSSEAHKNLIAKYQFSSEQAQAILDMKLSRLAKLEKVDLENEKKDLEALIITLKEIINNPVNELVKRLKEIVNKYGDDRRTELMDLEEEKEVKEIVNVEPEKCVVVLTEGGNIKRIPAASFKTQTRNAKGVKTQDDITSMIIRTNTIDNLMIFSNKGTMYNLLVDKIPVGTNTAKGQSVSSLVNMESGEDPSVIYSIYRDTKEQFVVFVTKNGLVKKTPLTEYTNRKGKKVAAIKLKDDDTLANVFLASDEDIIIVTKNGKILRTSLTQFPISSRVSMGQKGMSIDADDEVIGCVPIRNKEDKLAVFSPDGCGKALELNDILPQNRSGKGYTTKNEVSCITLISPEDKLLVVGTTNSICISAKEIPVTSTKTSKGNIIIKNNRIIGVSKI